MLRKYSAWAFSVAFVSYALFIMAMTAVMIKPLTSTFDMGLMHMAWLVSGFSYAYVFMQLPVGVLTDKFGATLILRASYLACALGCLLFAQATQFSEALLARVLSGVGASSALPVALYLSATTFKPKYFVLLVGIVEMIAASSAGISEPIMALLLDHFSWQSIVSTIGVIGLALTLSSVLLIPKSKPTCPDQKQPSKPREKINWGCVINRLTLVNGLIAGLLFAVVMSFAGLWSIPFLQHDYGLSHKMAAFYSSLCFMGTAIGSPLFGLFTRQKWLYQTLLTATLIATLLAILLINGAVHIKLLPIVMFLLGVCVSVFVLSYGIVKHNTPESSAGLAMAVVNIITGGVGALIFVPFIGYLVEGSTGPNVALEAALEVYSIGLLVAVLLVLSLRKDLITQESSSSS